MSRTPNHLHHHGRPLFSRSLCHEVSRIRVDVANRRTNECSKQTPPPRACNGPRRRKQHKKTLHTKTQTQKTKKIDKIAPRFGWGSNPVPPHEVSLCNHCTTPLQGMGTVLSLCPGPKPGQIGKTGSLSLVNGKEKVASTPSVLGLGSSRLVPLVLQAGLPSRELRALLALARTPGPPLSRRLLPPCLLLAPRSVTPWVEGPQSLLARLRLALALVDVRGTEGTSHWPA
jgi:hypothetical protein